MNIQATTATTAPAPLTTEIKEKYKMGKYKGVWYWTERPNKIKVKNVTRSFTSVQDAKDYLDTLIN